MRFMNTPNGFELQTSLDSAGREFQTALELRLEPFFMNTGTGLALRRRLPLGRRTATSFKKILPL